MKNLIKKIIKEQMDKKPYRLSVGGYLVSVEKSKYDSDHRRDIFLTDEEFNRIEVLNDKLKEMYELHKEKLSLIVKYNTGTLQHVIDKLREKKSFE
jgi:hypothetical protein